MDWLPYAALVVSVGALLVTLFKNNSSGVWALSDRLNKLDEARGETRRQIEAKIEDKNDETTKQFGETIRSYAEHMRLLELEVYKNFVRRDTFDATVKGITDAMNSRFDKLEQRIEEWRKTKP